MEPKLLKKYGKPERVTLESLNQNTKFLIGGIYDYAIQKNQQVFDLEGAIKKANKKVCYNKKVHEVNSLRIQDCVKTIKDLQLSEGELIKIESIITEFFDEYDEHDYENGHFSYTNLDKRKQIAIDFKKKHGRKLHKVLPETWHMAFTVTTINYLKKK